MGTIKILFAILLSFALASCGGGGGGAAPSINPTIVSGTAATGKPLGNAQITLTDANGVSRTATSSTSGSYTIDVTGLTAPFVVKATGLQGTLSVTLVSVDDTVVTSSTNVINITPWTTAISAMLSSTGFAKDLDAVNDKAKIISSLTTVGSYTLTLVAPTLTAAGLSTTADPITTSFVADGTGYDSFYDNLQVGQASNGTIFMAPARPTSPCAPGSSSVGGCWTASDPGDQTITNPNLCGFDIATGAGIPCDPSQPITAQPSVALPTIGNAALAFGCSACVFFGPSDILTLTVTKAGTGSGTVTSSPSGISFAAGTIVTLTATPATGSTFAGWSGACSGTGSCVVTMDANKAVTATFNSSVPGSSFNGTLSGSYSGSGTGITVTGGFSIAITNGSITGSYLGTVTSTNPAGTSTVSGSITGAVDATGNFSAASGGASGGSWTGTITKSGSVLSGSGTWTGTSLSGSWSGSGTSP